MELNVAPMRFLIFSNDFSAAHCILLSVEDPSPKPEDFLVMLGKYKIKKFNELGSVIAEVAKIDIHPENTIETADADLAILTLLKEVQISSYVSFFPDKFDVTRSVHMFFRL